jgi:hypothetical protein
MVGFGKQLDNVKSQVNRARNAFNYCGTINMVPTFVHPDQPILDYGNTELHDPPPWDNDFAKLSTHPINEYAQRIGLP